MVSSQAGFATTNDYLRAADAAMYQAKSHALGVCVFWNKWTQEKGTIPLLNFPPLFRATGEFNSPRLL